MDKSEQDKFVEKQGEEWSGVAHAWEKWDVWLDENMARCDELVLERAKVALGHNVLDLGSGTGYPALKAAAIVDVNGSVTGLDMAEEMLNVARRKAEALDLKHVSFKKCDVSRLPFEDGSFDAVTSRFCLMFLPEPAGTLNEVFRVLKKGGNFAGVVWGPPDKNPGLTLAIGML
ncbi:MAG TPA: class I SAM-dependent methyltransferase, partial [Nitrospirae bacterium]|nr:class I SAM-dependent methyltransferase [Nitrospirota bacterium]